MAEMTLDQEADAIASTLVEFCRAVHDAEGVEVLLHSTAAQVAEPVFEGVGDPFSDPLVGWRCTLTLRVERTTFEKYFPRRAKITKRLNDLCDEFIRPAGLNKRVVSVEIVPSLVVEDDWRLGATLYLAGIGLTNQGRAHSGNIAPLEFDG